MGVIPEWLHREVNDYFVEPIKIVPESVLDIGANVGAFAVRAHKEWPEARIICYEPMPFNVKLLRQNVDSSWCSVEPFAVRAEAGDADIFIGDMFVTGGFSKGQRQTDRTSRVKCVAARDLPSCDLVKVDTEGSEVEILIGLNLEKTRVVMLEHHNLADAQIIKSVLSRKFCLVHDETERMLGTDVFFRVS